MRSEGISHDTASQAIPTRAFNPFLCLNMPLNVNYAQKQSEINRAQIII